MIVLSNCILCIIYLAHCFCSLASVNILEFFAVLCGKFSSLIHSEGLVHVSDPPLLSRGNFLDCGVELDRRLLDYIVGLDTEINELVDGSVRRLPARNCLELAKMAHLFLAVLPFRISTLRTYL